MGVATCSHTCGRAFVIIMKRSVDGNISQGCENIMIGYICKSIFFSCDFPEEWEAFVTSIPSGTFYSSPFCCTFNPIHLIGIGWMNKFFHVIIFLFIILFLFLEVDVIIITNRKRVARASLYCNTYLI